MISFPNCKINLGLNVIRKRQDGYHDISSCFYPVQWNDILEIIPSESTKLNLSGNKVEGDQTNNLVIKAYELLKKDYDLPELDIYLHKSIPSGAGLGGGSSDGASMLKLINELFHLKIPNSDLESYALELGSDCPFFIQNLPVVASGRGEEFENLDFSLKGKYLVILKPDIHISTVEAYAGVSPTEPKNDIKKVLLDYDISEWQQLLVNDFEVSVFKNHPELAAVKSALIENGALYSSMSGSGSSIFGIFGSSVDLVELENKYVHWKGFLD